MAYKAELTISFGAPSFLSLLTFSSAGLTLSCVGVGSLASPLLDSVDRPPSNLIARPEVDKSQNGRCTTMEDGVCLLTLCLPPLHFPATVALLMK